MQTQTSLTPKIKTEAYSSGYNACLRQDFVLALKFWVPLYADANLEFKAQIEQVTRHILDYFQMFIIDAGHVSDPWVEDTFMKFARRVCKDHPTLKKCLGQKLCTLWDKEIFDEGLKISEMFLTENWNSKHFYNYIRFLVKAQPPSQRDLLLNIGLTLTAAVNYSWDHRRDADPENIYDGLVAVFRGWFDSDKKLQEKSFQWRTFFDVEAEQLKNLLRYLTQNSNRVNVQFLASPSLYHLRRIPRELDAAMTALLATVTEIGPNLYDQNEYNLELFKHEFWTSIEVAKDFKKQTLPFWKHPEALINFSAKNIVTNFEQVLHIFKLQISDENTSTQAENCLISQMSAAINGDGEVWSLWIEIFNTVKDHLQSPVLQRLREYFEAEEFLDSMMFEVSQEFLTLAELKLMNWQDKKLKNRTEKTIERLYSVQARKKQKKKSSQIDFENWFLTLTRGLACEDISISEICSLWKKLEKDAKGKNYYPVSIWPDPHWLSCQCMGCYDMIIDHHIKIATESPEFCKLSQQELPYKLDEWHEIQVFYKDVFV